MTPNSLISMWGDDEALREIFKHNVVLKHITAAVFHDTGEEMSVWRWCAWPETRGLGELPWCFVSLCSRGGVRTKQGGGTQKYSRVPEWSAHGAEHAAGKMENGKEKLQAESTERAGFVINDDFQSMADLYVAESHTSRNSRSCTLCCSRFPTGPVFKNAILMPCIDFCQHLQRLCDCKSAFFFFPNEKHKSCLHKRNHFWRHLCATWHYLKYGALFGPPSLHLLRKGFKMLHGRSFFKMVLQHGNNFPPFPVWRISGSSEQS